MCGERVPDFVSSTAPGEESTVRTLRMRECRSAWLIEPIALMSNLSPTVSQSFI